MQFEVRGRSGNFAGLPHVEPTISTLNAGVVAISLTNQSHVTDAARPVKFLRSPGSI